MRVTANCFSRVVMYALDDVNATADNATADNASANASASARAPPSKLARVVWQYEFPLQLKWSNWSDVMATDVFNACGGSVYPLANGNHLVAFTALDRAARAHNVSLVRTTYAWEIDFGSGAGASARAPEVRASLLLPIPHDAAGTQNSYRFVPWHSIAGESATRPFRRRARP